MTSSQNGGRGGFPENDETGDDDDERGGGGSPKMTTFFCEAPKAPNPVSRGFGGRRPSKNFEVFEAENQYFQ